MTHSLPALVVWPVILSVPLAAIFGVWDHVVSLFLWTMAAVVFHVFLDLFNVYGVQCFRPFSKKWNHLDTLCLYEPFLFGVHAIGAIAWISGLVTGHMTGWMFAWMYALTFIYIGIRYLQRKALIRMIKWQLQREGQCHVIPGLHWFRWHFVLEQDERFYIGMIHRSKVEVQEEYEKADGNQVNMHPIVKATMSTDGVRSFLHFAQRVHVCWKEKQDGYEVQWRDVRFWHNHKLPFGVDVRLDRDMNVVSDTLGWNKKAWDPPYV
ncbi:metal-dependent hydrolase [Paenibacillus hexagrammi]|uniref:Metal-dependent hydrolase n=1 Tax=Paenibacillus hexagrammi TaxID=2908839 RepID=A0ABY3SPR9_9BACL|nr:metal-dependent hydrolase [Paenibacillus sp. YPD9-1]UJF35984.1 metal-dependent hydrolase [Paenibacillus sp. YPD9-1]